MPRNITQSITLNQSSELVFDALIRPSLIKKWWSAAHAVIIPETGGLYAVTWGEDEDAPDYISAATIRTYEYPKRLWLTDYRYASKNGALPFQTEMDTEFLLEPQGDQVKLTVRQSGFPDEAVADDFYAACVKGWEDTLAGFKKVVESFN